MNESEPHAQNTWNKAVVLELVLLALVLCLAHYFFFRSLGLYEDGYSHIAPPPGWHLLDLPATSLDTFLTGPLDSILRAFLDFVGGKLGGLGAIYFMGYQVHATNASLFYFLLRRIGLARAASTGAIAFGLFPADTTHVLLMLALGLHTSLTFLLLASRCYLSGRRTLAYVLSLGSLLIYESP